MLSPDVLAAHQAALELQARDETGQAPTDGALTALEEDLVQRHQRELTLASTRDSLRRELAGVGRERLDELREAQLVDVARLERETAARSAERAALAEEVARLEKAAHVEPTPSTARSDRTLSDLQRDLRTRTPQSPQVLREPSKGEALETLVAELASPASLAAQKQRLADLRAEARPPSASSVLQTLAGEELRTPSRQSGDWSPAELLDAWLDGDPGGLLQGTGRQRTPTPAPPKPATPRQPTPRAPRQPTPRQPTPRRPTPAPVQQQQPPWGQPLQSQTFPPGYGYPPPQPPQQDSSLLQFQMMQLQQQQQQKFDEQLRTFKEETTRQSREAVEALRRENASLLTEVQRLQERSTPKSGRRTPASSRRPRTPAAAPPKAAPVEKDASALDDTQLRELAALDFELEKCRRREALMELRDRLDREAHEARQKREHEYWLEAQRRKIQALRVEKALQLEVETADVALDPYVPQHREYDESGFGVLIDGVAGDDATYRRVRVVYAIYDGSVPALGPLGRSRTTRWARCTDQATAVFTDAPALYVCGASSRLRLVLEVQASSSLEGDESVCLGCAAPPPFLNDGLRSGAWRLPLAPGPWKGDQAWPPSAFASDVRVRLFHALAPPPPHRVDCIGRGDRYGIWGGAVARPPQAAEAPPQAHRKVEAPPPQARQAPERSPSARPPSARPPSEKTPPATPPRPDVVPAFVVDSSSDEEDVADDAGDDVDVVDDEHGFLDTARPATTTPFKEGGGVDVFVDACRGLPDSAGASRATVRLYAQGAPVGADVVRLCDARGPRFAPRFNSVAEFRQPAFDPTSTLLIRIDVLDEDKPSGAPKKARCLGYALLNLFHAAGDTKAQPSDATEKTFCLNEGGWQLPIYTKPHPSVSRLRWDSLTKNRAWPGCSVLVRVKMAVRSADGLEILARATVPKQRWAALGLDAPAPLYRTGAYDSSRCAMSALDRDLVTRRRRRRDPGLESGLVEDTGRAVAQAMADLFKPGVDHFQGMGRAVAYAPDLGFSLAVDGLRNLPAKGKGMFSSGRDPPAIYKVVTVVTPHLFFQDPPVSDDAQFTLKHDWDAPVDAPTYDDGLRQFRDKPAGPLAAVFEVRRFKDAVTAALDDEAFFAVLPILQKPARPSSFLARKAYVDSGSFVLPLFRGRCPRSVLDASDTYQAVLSSNLEVVPGASCVVRLVDAQLDAVDPGPPYRTDHVQMVCRALKLKASSYLFPEKDLKAPKSKRLRKLAPSRTSVDTVQTALNTAFAGAVGIRHSRPG